jgi:hypothetical protein
MKEERRTVKASAKLTPREGDALTALARADGRTKSAVIARLIVAAAKKEGMWEEESDG